MPAVMLERISSAVVVPWKSYRSISGPDIADSIGPDISTVRAGDILPVAVDDLEIAVALAVELDGADDIIHRIPTVERTGDLTVKIQRNREQQFVFGVRVVAGEYI